MTSYMQLKKLYYSQKNALLNILERHLVSHVSIDSLHCSQKLVFNEPDKIVTNSSVSSEVLSVSRPLPYGTQMALHAFTGVKQWFS